MLRTSRIAALTTVLGGIVAAQMVDYNQQIKNKPGLYGYVQSASIATNCTNANAANLQLVVPSLVASMTTQTINCKSIKFAPGAKFQPASGQVVTITGVIDNPPVQIFDTSVGGAGSILLTGTQNTAVYTQWFGAKMDGNNISKTDDHVAWAATLAACPSTGCEIDIPANANSWIGSTGVIISQNYPIKIVGRGRTSVISGSGGPIVQFSTTGTGAGQGLETLQINDPTGSVNTIGLNLNVTANITQTQQFFRDIVITGNPSNPLGTGIKINSLSSDASVLTNFDGLTEAYFNIGMQTNGFANLWATHTRFFNNVTYGWDNESRGDSSMSQSDFENNGIGYYSGTTAQNVVISTTHFENNTTNQFELNSGEMYDFGNNYTSGTALVDSSGVLVSHNSQMSGFVITNNGTGGGTGQSGVTLFYPLLFNMSTGFASGTGWGQVWTRLGLTQYVGSNPVGPTDFTFGAVAAGHGYIFGSPGLGTWQGNLIATGTAPVVSTGQVSFGGQTVASSFCGSLSGAVGCLKLNIAGTVAYIPVWE